MTPEWLAIIACSLGLNVVLMIALGVTLRLVWQQARTLERVEKDLTRMPLPVLVPMEPLSAWLGRPSFTAHAVPQWPQRRSYIAARKAARRARRAAR